MKSLSKFLKKNLHWLIVGGVALLCALFIIFGHTSENGQYRTLDGNDAQIPEATAKFIEDSEAALYRLMNEDKPTDEIIEKENDTDEVGLGFSTSLSQILSRRLPDGDTDNGKGWQCSKYTGYLATGKREYSSAHPDYGPRNGKDMAQYLVDYYGFKYVDTPVAGAIGSGGWNTLYGHTVVYLFSTGDNTAMINEANYVSLTVGTRNMNISGWVWVVPGDYEPTPEPSPVPSPDAPEGPSNHQDISTYYVNPGDTLGAIMKRYRGYIDWGDMDNYAQHWFSTKINPGQSVYAGWNSRFGVGLYANDIIEYRP